MNTLYLHKYNVCIYYWAGAKIIGILVLLLGMVKSVGHWQAMKHNDNNNNFIISI